MIRSLKKVSRFDSRSNNSITRLNENIGNAGNQAGLGFMAPQTLNYVAPNYDKVIGQKIIDEGG